MKITSVALVLLLLLTACEKPGKMAPWELVTSIPLEGVNPIGLAFTEEGLWLSDGDRNRLVLVDLQGKVVRTIDSLERPMHITSAKNTLYVPLYGNDLIVRINKKAMHPLPLTDSLDAPAGVSVYGNETAIADFYNHRVLYSADGIQYTSIGREGKGEGELFYPTDVQLTADKVWVADAYNNRIQVFNKEGEFISMMGSDQKMNAATGVFVTETEVFVTDFENDRVLVFDHSGTVKQLLTEGIEKPTDVLVHDGALYIANYRNGLLQVLEPKK